MAIPKLLAGYGRKEITPKEPVPLAGYGGTDHRISNHILDTLFATAICVTGTNGETVFFLTADAINMPAPLAEKIREKVREEIDIPENHFFLASTHSHSTPDKYATKNPAIVRYNEYFVEQAAEACIEAYEDRRPAVMYHGGKVTAGLNFVRHYRMEDGTYAGSNFGDFRKRIVAFAADPDHRLRVIQFRREVGKDIVMVNFQAHACCTGGMKKFDVSADYIGVVRRRVEAATGCDFAYFLGATGNVNMVSWWGTQGIFKRDDNDGYGKALSDVVLEALATLRPVEGTNVRVTSREYLATHDHSQDGEVEKVRGIVDYFMKSYDRAGADKMAQELGYNSVYACTSILHRATLSPTETFSISAAAVGDVGFAGAPYEMFSHNGFALRDKSPMGETIIMTCCNGAKGYFASREAFEHGCYEVENRTFVKGTAEDMIELFLDMLNEMKEK